MSREDQERGRQSQMPFRSTKSLRIDLGVRLRNILRFDFCDG